MSYIYPPDVAELQDELSERLEDIRILADQKNAAYHERNQLVAALSRLFPSHLARHPDYDDDWEADWRWIVCIHLRERRGHLVNMGMEKFWTTEESQATWHIHDSELPLFRHLSEAPNDWDGHSTADKYDRLTRITLEELPPPSYLTKVWRALRGA